MVWKLPFLLLFFFTNLSQSANGLSLLCPVVDTAMCSLSSFVLLQFFLLKGEYRKDIYALDGGAITSGQPGLLLFAANTSDSWELSFCDIFSSPLGNFPKDSGLMQGSRQWPAVYDLCHTFSSLHVARVGKHTDMRELHALHAFRACPCVLWLAQRAKTCDKIWTSGHCLKGGLLRPLRLNSGCFQAMPWLFRVSLSFSHGRCLSTWWVPLAATVGWQTVLQTLQEHVYELH